MEPPLAQLTVQADVSKAKQHIDVGTGTAVGATVGEDVGVAVGIIVGTAVVGIALGGAVTAAAAVTVTLRTLFPFNSATYTLSLLSIATPVGKYRFAAVA